MSCMRIKCTRWNRKKCETLKVRTCLRRRFELSLGNFRREGLKETSLMRESTSRIRNPVFFWTCDKLLDTANS